jgi:protein-S-isoprenylcysteine O-methyltransferase Ste14
LYKRLKQRSTLTGLAATLFAVGTVLLFVALYSNAGRGNGPLWAVALGVLAATVVCWMAAAQWGEEPAPSPAPIPSKESR